MRHHRRHRARDTHFKLLRRSVLPSRSIIAQKQRQRQGNSGCALHVCALDAAMPFDFEAKEEQRRRAIMNEKKSQTVGIIGFGNFGQFLAERFVREGHRVIATSRGDYSQTAKMIGVDYFRDIDDFCEEHPEIVVMCTSILSLEKVLGSIPFQRLKRSTLFVDVLSVKEFPRQLMLNKLPEDFDILCTHPMFGPESGKGRWDGLPFVYEKVRIRDHDERRFERVELFLDFFTGEGCRMVEMSCLEHDRLAASSQFVTHTIGRMLGRLEMRDTTINTKGYESLLTLVENTSNDSFDLFYGLFMYNVNATEELERMELAFDEVKKELFGRMHTAVRQQLFEDNLKESKSRDPAHEEKSPSHH